jgi:hypothetical protein
MDDLLEVRLRILELAYKYDKPVKDVIEEFVRIGITPKAEEKK